ncbi:aspartate ammonia-lyase [Simiduia sp. 21SJ11W-1]|uniref:aspartate ammonia-lyase n=1 Tax=Simiduia sp. 21SJ11W-1 TaxID=2909669 RepID=UPI0020A1A67C|nr:aspartate ammonia-lyase [Simiduia sp. 21SJ11W-1]UTA47721.1 aspartate ammonia-lyase [Simiduia sp. 21SJ11W-1]
MHTQPDICADLPAHPTAAMMPSANTAARTRTEQDSLGSRTLEDTHYYGIQTLRALENFSDISRPLSDYPQLIVALAAIKRACAEANGTLGLLPEASQAAIVQACNELMAGHWHQHFPVSLVQGGAGTSTNMNANEVITNRALEILGKPKGRYDLLNPNDQVNAGQSTNDVYPSALRIALYQTAQPLLAACSQLAKAFTARAELYKDVDKVARTQLQDAVPMAAADELRAFAQSLQQCMQRIDSTRTALLTLNLGGTAVGSCINSSAEFRELSLKNLCAITQLPLRRAADLYQASWDTGDLVDFSSTLKRLAVSLSKIASDLRLLSSGPQAGLAELSLPKQQPGSSIMPGKVNPVIPELINQIAFDVCGRDATLCQAAEHGQLQLNAFEPVMAECLFTSLERLRTGCELLRTKCVENLHVNGTQCTTNLHRSHALATRFNQVLGYVTTSRLILQAEQEGVNFIELVRRQALVTEQDLQAIISRRDGTNV